MKAEEGSESEKHDKAANEKEEEEANRLKSRLLHHVSLWLLHPPTDYIMIMIKRKEMKALIPKLHIKLLKETH